MADATVGLTEPLRNEDGWINITKPADDDSTDRRRRRMGKLSLEDYAHVHAMASTLSLREIAARFGVSHQTVANTIKQSHSISRMTSEIG